MPYKAHNKHIIKECTKYATQRMNLNMPHNMLKALDEAETTTIIKFLTETTILWLFHYMGNI